MKAEKEIAEADVLKMIAFLADPNPHFQEAARKTLGEYYDTPSGKPIVTAQLVLSLESPDQNTQINSAIVIGDKQIAEAIPGLIKAHEGGGELGKAAKHAIIQISAEPKKLKPFHKEITPVLIKFLEEEENETFTSINRDLRTIIKALGDLKAVEAIPALRAKLEAQASTNYDSGIGDALQKIGKTSIPQLIEVLETGSISAKADVIEVLGNMQAEEAIPGLIKALRISFCSCCTKAEQALKKIGDKSVPQLMDAMREAIRETQEIMLRAPHGPSSFANDADRHAWDECKLQADGITRLFGEFKAKQACPLLIGLFNDPHHPHIWSDRTIIALGKIGDKRAIKPLVKLGEKVHNETKGNLFWSLGELGSMEPETVCPYLARQLDDELSVKSQNASAALVRVGPPAIPFLKDALRRSHSKYGTSHEGAIITVLMQLGAIPLEELIKMYSDSKDRSNRKEIADGIVSYGAKAVIPLIRKAVFEHTMSIEDCEGLLNRIKQSVKNPDTGVVAQTTKPPDMARKLATA